MAFAAVSNEPNVLIAVGERPALNRCWKSALPLRTTRHVAMMGHERGRYPDSHSAISAFKVLRIRERSTSRRSMMDNFISAIKRVSRQLWPSSSVSRLRTSSSVKPSPCDRYSWTRTIIHRHGRYLNVSASEVGDRHLTSLHSHFRLVSRTGASVSPYCAYWSSNHSFELQ